MKKYFVNGKQISETEAILIDMENNRRNIKRTKKGAGATVKLVGIQIDNDLLPFLNALPNKSRFINDLLRKKFFGK